MMNRVGVGTRVVNFMVDTLLLFVVAYIASKTWNWYVMYWRYPYLNFGWFFFGSMFVYYTAFEALTARTPGKWLSASRVVNAKGRKPGFLQVLLRSAARITIIDLFFIPFFDKPLHDLVSRTEVVEA